MIRYVRSHHTTHMYDLNKQPSDTRKLCMVVTGCGAYIGVGKKSDVPITSTMCPYCMELIQEARRG